MTMHQANMAARMKVPVMLTLPNKAPMEYARILQVGYSYYKDGQKIPFVQLLDKCGRSVVTADPAYVEVNLYVNDRGQMKGKDDLHESS